MPESLPAERGNSKDSFTYATGATPPPSFCIMTWRERGRDREREGEREEEKEKEREREREGEGEREGER